MEHDSQGVMDIVTSHGHRNRYAKLAQIALKGWQGNWEKQYNQDYILAIVHNTSIIKEDLAIKGLSEKESLPRFLRIVLGYHSEY